VRKIAFIAVAVTFFMASTAMVQAATITLAKDTYLHPQGWVAGSLKFKGGTKAVLNEQGEVVSGTTVYNEQLQLAGTVLSDFTDFTPSLTVSPRSKGTTFGRIRIGGESQVVFNSEGQVMSGILGETCNIKLMGKREVFVRFLQGTVISFNEDGSVRQGTLAEDMELRPVGWKNYLPIDENAGFLKFKTDTEVFFGPDAQVVRGTLAKDHGIAGKTYPKDRVITFTQEGPR
jgi:hypothetical protein